MQHYKLLRMLFYASDIDKLFIELLNVIRHQTSVASFKSLFKYHFTAGFAEQTVHNGEVH